MLHLLGSFSASLTHEGNSYSWVRVNYDDSTDAIRVFYNEYWSNVNGVELGQISGVVNPTNWENVPASNYSNYSFVNGDGALVQFKQISSYPYFEKEVEDLNPPPPQTFPENILGGTEGTWQEESRFYFYARTYWVSETEEFKVVYFSDEASANLGLGGYEGTPSGDATGVDTTQYSPYQFCQGSTLMRFRRVAYYPYFVLIPVENSFVCANIVCDLAFKNPIITPNHVEVEATSSYLPVEYSLDSNFIYGFGQPFGVFDLEPGTWTIHAKDGAGCKKSINVYIPNIPGYGLRYSHSYRDITGGQSLVEIYEKNYNGSVKDVLGAQDSTEITWGERGGLRNNPINGSEANFSWICENDDDFIDLYTSDSEKFRIDFKKEGVLMWSGYLTPQLYNEPYIQPPYYISFTANDGLGKLRDIPYMPDYELYPEYFTGRRSHLQVILDCLNKLRLNLPLYVAVNVFEDNQPLLLHEGQEYQETLSQVFVNTDNYRTGEFSVMSCYDVLQEQLKPYGARLYQSNGAWHVIKFDHTNGEYLRHSYSSTGVYNGSELHEPIITVAKPSLSNKKIWIHGDMLKEINPGYRYNDYLQDLGYVENLIPDGTFDKKNLDSFTFGVPSYANPIFWEFARVDREKYALSWKYNYTNAGFIGSGIVKVKVIITSGIQPSGSVNSSYFGVNKDDLVLLSHPGYPQNNGVWRVVENGPWIREANYVSISPLLPVYILPSYGGSGVYYVTRNANNYTVHNTSIDSIPEMNKQSFWIQNKPVNIDYVAGDKLKIVLNKKLDYQGAGMDVRVRLEVKVGDLWLNDSFLFTTQYNFIEVAQNPDKDFNLIEILGDFRTAGNGDLTVKIWFVNQTFVFDYGSGSTVGTNVELYFGPDYRPYPNFLLDYVKAVYLPGGFEPDLSKTELLRNSNRYTHIPDTIEAMHGDAPEVLNKDKIYDHYLTLADGTLTQKWFRKNYYERKNLLKLLLESLMAQSLKSNYLITGTIREYLTLNDTIYDPESHERLFMIISATYRDHIVETEVELSEITLFDDMSNPLAGFTRGFSIGFNS